MFSKSAINFLDFRDTHEGKGVTFFYRGPDVVEVVSVDDGHKDGLFSVPVGPFHVVEDGDPAVHFFLNPFDDGIGMLSNNHYLQLVVLSID